jgi:hypothetical protein
MIECTIRYGMGQAAQQTRDLSPLLAVPPDDVLQLQKLDSTNSLS